MKATAIRDGWSETQTELEFLRASRPKIPMNLGVANGPDHTPRNLLCAAALLHMGKGAIAEKELGAGTCQRAHDLHVRSLVDLCAAALIMSGQQPPHDRNELLKAAFSTSALSEALATTGEKIALAAYRETPASWRAFAKVVPVRDFKVTKLLRVVWAGGFQKLPPGGELHYGALDSEHTDIHAETSGMVLGIDRTSVVNDDAGVFSDTATGIGRAGARYLNDVIYQTLLTNHDPDGVDFFSEAHVNYDDGGPTALSIAALTAAVASMAARTDGEGKCIDLRARTLLVPPELESAAQAILASQTLARYVADGTDLQPEGNPMFRSLALAVEPRLSAAAYTGNSKTGWYLFAQPADGAVAVCFLDGKDSPTVERVEGPMDRLGLFYRGFLDCGCSLADYRAATLYAGA